MKKCLKKLLIIAMAVVCACSIHITVNAESNEDTNWGFIEDLINQVVSSLNPNNTTTAENPDNTTTTNENPDNTTTDPNNPDNTTVNDPINNSGTGTVPSSDNTTNYPTVAPDNNYPTVPEVPTITTEPVGEPEESSFTYEGSLSDLLEDDSAAIIVQAPTESFTLNNGLVVNNNDDDDDFTWQKAALVAAAVLFVVLAALIGALLVQRSKRAKEEVEERRRNATMYSSSSSSKPVSVEVMSPERIAELLGSATANKAAATADVDMHNMTSEESAAAIKAAILMGQLSQSYSDPLIRKYTEEPVMISPVSKVNLEEGVTGAQILEATDSMLDDITGNEKFAADTSGLYVSADDIDSILADTKTRICPECQNPVASGDVFCHGCGAYVG